MEINFASGNIRFAFTTGTASGQCLLGPVPTLLEFQTTAVPRQNLTATTVSRQTVTHPTQNQACTSATNTQTVPSLYQPHSYWHPVSNKAEALTAAKGKWPKQHHISLVNNMSASLQWEGGGEMKPSQLVGYTFLFPNCVNLKSSWLRV